MSNLLKDASILLTPTAYDNGRMNAIKPYKDLYGSELVANGDFSNGLTDWSTYGATSVSSGIVTIGASANSGIYQGVLIQGKKYKATINVTSYDGVGNAQVVNDNGFVLHTITTTGLQTFYFEHSISNLNIIIRATQNGVLSISSFSVVEDLSGDFQFSRNSAATRVNAQGLVENVQIISDELVSNGNFSEIGTEEVLNGNFSQEGSELVTNGDFSVNGIVNTSSYTLGWYSPDSDLSISDGKLIITNGASVGGRAYGTNGVNSLSFLTSGKSYKLVYTIIENNDNASVTYHNGGAYVTAPNTVGTHTIYYQADGAIFILRNNTANTTLTIDNVSVKEVGQNWTFNNDVSIGDGVATFLDGGSNPNTQLVQSNILTSGKNYKITFDVARYVAGNVQVFIGSSAVTYNVDISNGAGTYTLYGVSTGTDLTIKRNGTYPNFDFDVTNISVKEVGQDWTIEDVWTIEDGVANGNGANGNNEELTQSLNFDSSKKYKISYQISNYVSGSVRYSLAGGGGYNGQNKSANGTYVDIINTGASHNQIKFFGLNFNGSVTNISVKEITDDTNIPRINYEGFSYQDTLGSELVVNGDFSNGSANWSIENTWTIENGVANGNGANGSSEELFQSGVFIGGKTYSVTYEIKNYVSGSVKTQRPSGISRSANGVYTEILAANVTLLKFRGTNFNGSIDNVSVKEYLGQEVVPDSGCGSWLLEPQSTNLIPYSEDFSQWTTVGSPTITSNYGISPDGNQNSTRMELDASERIYFILSASGDITFSVYLKGSGVITLRDNTNVYLQDVTLTSEWARYDLSFNSTITNVQIQNQTASVLDCEIWGAQLEQQSYATSYIPTNGATNTRLQDIANNSGNSSLINSTEGVLYAEIAALADDGINRYITISDSSNSNYVRLTYTTTSNQLGARYYVNGSFQCALTHILTDETEFTKAAFKWKENDFALWVDGTEVATDASGNVNPENTFHRLDFRRQDGFFPFYGKVKALAVYKEALTDAELQSLTTI